MHIPVMLEETVELLKPSPKKTIVDCTLGFGGHAAMLLAKGARVIGIDRDFEAIEAAKEKLNGNENIVFRHGNFADIPALVEVPVDGFLFDLGVSSYQIDEGERGFSMRFDGPLDMRMDRDTANTAADIINSYSKEELERIFFEYGEERFSKRIAGGVVRQREKKPIETTFELKELIEKAIPTWKKRESVSRIFQAVRIEVNSELHNLGKALADALKMLKKEGRLVVISYHSLEDRLVKKFFVENKKNGILELITKKPLTATEAEIANNRRAKSAKLRCAEKK